MEKKILGMLSILFACICVLVACNVDSGATTPSSSIVAHTHSYGAWVTVLEVTCTTDGVETRICGCGETETRVIAAKNHTEGEWIVDKETSCSEEGSKHQICSVCNETIKTESISKKSHTYGEWITKAEATCTENGSICQICSVCQGTIRQEIVQKRGHAYSIVVDKEATCTEEGSWRQICTNCDTVFKTVTVPKLYHSQPQGICSRCGEECDILKDIIILKDDGDVYDLGYSQVVGRSYRKGYWKFYCNVSISSAINYVKVNPDNTVSFTFTVTYRNGTSYSNMTYIGCNFALVDSNNQVLVSFSNAHTCQSGDPTYTSKEYTVILRPGTYQIRTGNFE